MVRYLCKFFVVGAVKVKVDVGEVADKAKTKCDDTESRTRDSTCGEVELQWNLRDMTCDVVDLNST